MTTKRKPSENEVQSLIDSIKASDVVESRTQLISELGELDVSDENERASILECLTTFWEDFTCLDVSQCMLNKIILQVASNYLESNISKCLSQVLALGTKGSIWFRKHMKMTLMSNDDSQEEEHYGLFFQVICLNPDKVGEVIAAVCSENPSQVSNAMTISSKPSSSSGKPSMDVAVSVLIKLVIDMYVLDSGVAAPFMLSMLEEILSSSQLTSKVRAFDLIVNLGVHGHLLEPLLVDDASTIEEEYTQEPYLDKTMSIQGTRKPDCLMAQSLSAINNFESWILCMLYEVLLLLVQAKFGEAD